MPVGLEGHPRQRRARAHTMLARASQSLLPEDFLVAKRAVHDAGTSTKTRASHFEQDLAGIEKKVVGDITLQNRTEIRLLKSVVNAFGNPYSQVGFQDIFGRPGTSPADRELAEQFRPNAEALANALPIDTLRNPVKPNCYIPYSTAGRDARELLDMTFLVAMQPEIPVPPQDKIKSLTRGKEVMSISKSSEVEKARNINNTIYQARLMAEIMLERFDTTDQTGTKTPPPKTVLSERYLAQRGQMRDSIRAYMETFGENLHNEYLEVLGSYSNGHIVFSHPELGANLNDAIAYSDIYRATHPGLPWYDMLGPRRRVETKSPDEVVARLRDAKNVYSEEYGAMFDRFADEMAETFALLQEAPGTPINLSLPVGGGYEREGYSQAIMHRIVGNGDKAVRSLRKDLDDDVQSQTTHPIPGTNLFMVITALYRGPHERLIGDEAPRFGAGLKHVRHVVSSDFLTPSVKRAFDIRNAKTRMAA